LAFENKGLLAVDFEGVQNGAGISIFEVVVKVLRHFLTGHGVITVSHSARPAN
jgi:hypothetical protein